MWLVVPRQPALAAPDADLWPDWQAYDPQSTLEVDHGAWQVVLDRYVTVQEPGVTSFDYAAASQDGGTAMVDAYVMAMTKVAVDQLNRDQQFAYWVNLYNALTVKVVLDHYPVDSIRDIDISPGLFSSGPWGKKLITVEGRTLSLNDIEHRILRPIWRDARIHYAVNCASIGCPALAPEAYEASKLDDQLDQAAKGFINHSRAVRVGADGGLVLSSLYDWYRGDFGKSDADFIAHLMAFAGPELMAILDDTTELDIADYEYDWALNAR
ncbi:hypothetical protein UF64_00505 [Thalassospira sp. HJ]|nr:hypothetical protein UF64_00505 [Thalassospira sp. HJ]